MLYIAYTADGLLEIYSASMLSGKYHYRQWTFVPQHRKRPVMNYEVDGTMQRSMVSGDRLSK